MSKMLDEVIDALPADRREYVLAAAEEQICDLEKYIEERDQRSPGFGGLVKQKVLELEKVEIRRQQDRLEELRKEAEHWPPMESRVGCLQDRIHPASGKLISSKPIHLATYLERFIRPHND
jgi:uncharacterized protein YydD (DUF2326 family)